MRECLKNLVFYQCLSSEQLIFALVTCENLMQTLLSQGQLASILPIFIDSINSNFDAFDRFHSSQLGWCENDHTESYSVQLIKKLVNKFNVCVIASRLDLSHSSTLKSVSLSETAFQSSSYKKWQALVSKRVELVARSGECELATDPDADVCRFYLRCSQVVAKNESTEKMTNVLRSFSRFVVTNGGFSFLG